MGWSAFRAEGLTQAISVATTASTAIQATGFSGEPICCNFILSNASTQPVFVGVGTNTSFLAVIPTPGAANAQRGYWLGPNAAQSITEAPNAWFSVIAPTGTSTVYITPGDGL